MGATMSKRPVLTMIVLAALAASSASAQLRGVVGSGAPIGGLGGTVGGALGGGVGGAVDGISRTVGGTVSETFGGTVGGGLGQIGGRLGGSVTQVGSGQYGAFGNLRSYGFTSNELGDELNPGMLLDDVSDLDLSKSTARQLAEIRQLRHQMLIRAYGNVLDRDGEGQPVRKGELIVTNPDPASLAVAEHAGFRWKSITIVDGLGIRVYTLSVPRGMNVRKGIKELQRIAPALQADYNHVYEPAGGALLPAAGVALAAAAPSRRGMPARSATTSQRVTRIAMIDGGIATHPSLAAASIEQRGFAGPPQPTGHGTAIGSLLVGSQGPFRGAARGAQLYVGDVYGGNPAAGTSTAIIGALAWAASKNPAVINVSLVGPPNRSLERAISAVRARGIALVAAVGNDGPAAPPQYPASYPGVIAVTGVDAADRALREAGRAAHLDFAAPGADLVAALPGNGFTTVRGTSFAGPFVAARLAATGSPALLAAEAVPGKGRVGRGIVCRTCRVLPKLVGLK